MLLAIVEEVRDILAEVDVRPPAPGARPGMAPRSTSRLAGGSIARQMQRPVTPRAMIDAQRRNRQLQQAARQTAMRQQKAAAATRRSLTKQTAPQGAPTAS